MKNKIFALALLVLALNCCTATDFRKSVGISKPAPDEFLVIPRENLRIPDAVTELPIPQKKRDSAVMASEDGRDILFGKSATVKTNNSALENAIAAKTGADSTDPKIRKTVNKEFKNETGVFGTKKGGTLESILDPFGVNSSSDPVVDGRAENNRIKSELASGKKVDPKNVKKLDPRTDKSEEEIATAKAKKKNEKEYENNIILNKTIIRKKPVDDDIDADPSDEADLH